MLTFTIRTIARILTYILAIVTFVAAWGGYVPPNIWPFPQFLILIYPYLAILTLIVGVVWLCCRRFITAAVCALALIGSSTSLFTIFPIATEKKAHPGEIEFSIMTYNVMHGVNNSQSHANRNLSLSYILNSNADIVCLQELFNVKEMPGVTPEQKDSLHSLYPYIAGAPQTDITILSKYPITEGKIGKGYYYNSFEQFTIDIKGHKVSLISCHLASYMLSNRERNVVSDMKGPRSVRNSISKFKGSILSKMERSYRSRAYDASTLREMIESIKGPLIVCGDFNDVPASWAYRTIRGDDLSDAYCDTGLGMMITYNQHYFWFHIDQILYRPGKLRPLWVKKDKIPYSDHYPQIATFALKP